MTVPVRAKDWMQGGRMSCHISNVLWMRADVAYKLNPLSDNERRSLTIQRDL